MDFSCLQPQMSLNVMVDGRLERIRFINGIFETKDPKLQDAIKAHAMFGRLIKIIGEESKPSTIPAKAKTKNKKVKAVAGEKEAINSLMETSHA